MMSALLDCPLWKQEEETGRELGWESRTGVLTGTTSQLVRPQVAAFAVTEALLLTDDHHSAWPPVSHPTESEGPDTVQPIRAFVFLTAENLHTARPPRVGHHHTRHIPQTPCVSHPL